jgi:SAM-dependent methyltransferase
MLSLSPLVARVEDRRGPRAQVGIAHRLNGRTLGLSPDLAELFESEPAEVPAEAREAWEALAAFGFLVPSPDPAALLAPFAGHRLIRPWMNPAISYRQGDEERLVRLEETALCRLPRGPRPPRLVDEPIGPAAARVLRLADGSRTLAEVARICEGGLAELYEPLDFLTRPERQAVRLAPPGTDLGDPRTPLHWLQQSFAVTEDEGTAGQGGATGRPFYENAVDDALWNFDWVEPTVSHAFRFPTAALGQEPYGERLGAALLGRLGRRPEGEPLRILEIGGGAGYFAQAFLRRARALRGPAAAVEYTIFDCSPALAARQRDTLRDAPAALRFVRGDAEELHLPGERFDLIVANEVIADLTVELDAASQTLIHRGILALLDRLGAHLAPHGLACLTEYGTVDEPPARVEHLNHPEFSIHFGPLLEHAGRRGLAAELRPLGDMLAVHPEAEMLCGQQERILCLRHLFARHGAEVPFAAFCREGFTRRFGELAERLEVGGLAFAPLAAGLHYGPDLAQFQALLLRPR